MSGTRWDDAAAATGPAVPHGRRWWFAVGAAGLLTGLLAVAVLWLLIEGVGIWGNNIPVAWALDIVGYDWWIGVASGALLVSAVLLLAEAPGRAGLSRITDTTALLAACAAALYPLIHLGRPWLFYWTLPYPNTFLLWPQVRSPLFWDAIDIISYLLVCACFWYVGLLPDLAVMRDRAVERAQAEAARRRHAPRLLRAQLYGIAALGWRGSQRHWHRWRDVHRCLAIFAVAVVVLLQTGAAVMFAGSAEPGWHDTLLPVTAIVGAALTGVAVVAVLVVVLRVAFGLGDVIGAPHLDLLARLLLALGLVNIYCYGASFALSVLAGTPFEAAVMARRLAGPHAWSGWAALLIGPLSLQAFWLPALRRTPAALLVVGLAVAAASWADHFMMVVVTLQHDFLPSAARDYRIGAWGLATFAGTAGLFALLMLIAVRLLPIATPSDGRAGAHGMAEDALEGTPLWGVAAEFATAEALLAAVHAAGAGDFGRIDAYAPHPIDGVAQALRLRPRPVAGVALTGALLGGTAMFAVCVYATTIAYPLDVGGRPWFGWPSFVVPSVSFAMLAGALVATVTMLILCRLPRLNHPAFNIEGFARATRDRYFVAIEAGGARFDPATAEALFATLADAPLRITRVPR